ncbi:MAG: DUF2510 domain-containing protein [Protaetiibacter sp.]
MTDPTASGEANAAPGWYPDGTGAQRWWNGSGWSEHTAPAVPATAQPVQRPALPAGTRIDDAWVWIVSLSYLLGVIPLFFLDMNAYIRAVFHAQLSGSAGGLTDALTGYTVFALVSWLLGLALWGLTIFAAYRDYRHLEAIGVVRPFHWAFAFIPYTIVYLIGRHVVLRKVSRTAGWPLWAHIGSYALVFIGVIVWTFVMMQAMFAIIASGAAFS